MSEQSWPVSWSRQLDRLRRHPATLTWPGGSVTGLIEKVGPRVMVKGRRVLWVHRRNGTVEHPEANRLIEFALRCEEQFAE